jgi:plastocyanin
MSIPASRPAASGSPERRALRQSRYRAGVAAVLVVAALPALAAAVHTVAQRGRAFAVSAIKIARGDSIRFTNEDEFLHQIYVDSKEMVFDSDEQLPGQTIDVRFPQAGTFPVRCHIHPKMLLTVQVN